MKDKLPFPPLDTPAALASCNGWTEEVYRDLLALQEGAISHDTLDAKYLYRRAILTLDLTGFTVQATKARSMRCCAFWMRRKSAFQRCMSTARCSCARLSTTREGLSMGPRIARSRRRNRSAQCPLAHRL